MSMRDPLFGDAPIPEQTAQIARRAFPTGNLFMQVRDRLGMLYQNHQFAHLFSREGQPALAPARIALICVFQYLEGLTDRQAAEAVRDRISWKYALGLELDDPGFHYSVLSEFRARLLTDDPEALLLTTILDLLVEQRLLTARGQQRTDATHVLAAVRLLGRLDGLMETIHAALNALATAEPAWVRQHADPAWIARYGDHIDRYQLPKTAAKREALMHAVFADTQRLFDRLAAPATPATLRTLPAVIQLWQRWISQVYVDTIPGQEARRWRTETEHPPAAQRQASPYDPDARVASKRGMTWLGYKVHLTETCDDDAPQVITDVLTTPATTSDYAVVEPIYARLSARKLLPRTHYLDGGYVDLRLLLDGATEQQVEVVGPVGPEKSWQGRTPEGVTLAQFVMDWEQRQAICPAGQVSQSWHKDGQRNGTPVVRIRWDAQVCGACTLRAGCTRSAQGRTVHVPEQQADYAALQEARAQQTTADWQRRYQRRAGIEGTLSQGVRRCDLRHARYRGLGKTHLQHVLSAIALTLLRVIAWLRAEPRATTRHSTFVRVMTFPLPRPAPA